MLYSMMKYLKEQKDVEEQRLGEVILISYNNVITKVKEYSKGEYEKEKKKTEKLGEDTIKKVSIYKLGEGEVTVPKPSEKSIKREGGENYYELVHKIKIGGDELIAYTKVKISEYIKSYVIGLEQDGINYKGVKGLKIEKNEVLKKYCLKIND